MRSRCAAEACGSGPWTTRSARASAVNASSRRSCTERAGKSPRRRAGRQHIVQPLHAEAAAQPKDCRSFVRWLMQSALRAASARSCRGMRRQQQQTDAAAAADRRSSSSSRQTQQQQQQTGAAAKRGCGSQQSGPAAIVREIVAQKRYQSVEKLNRGRPWTSGGRVGPTRVLEGWRLGFDFEPFSGSITVAPTAQRRRCKAGAEL
jgi:hypothetical protein